MRTNKMIDHRSFEERRDSARARRIITVRHRLVQRKSGKVVDADWQLSTTENMSLSGILFVSAAHYALGDIVELQVVMSGVLDIFNGYAQVMRVSKHKGSYYHIGVKYVEVKLKKRAAKSLLRMTD